MPNFSENSFNLIRLLAAFQVLHYHLISYVNIKLPDWYLWVIKFLGLFPGVPIFFFISGFLISRSWDSSRNVLSYAKRRAFRIFPALIVSVVLAILLVVASGYLDGKLLMLAPDILIMFFAKITLFQFYNPDFMRAFGDGVLNGSLWTITVELQFYILTPLLLFLLPPTSRNNLVILVLAFVFMSANQAYYYYHGANAGATADKLLKVTFLPWFYMFLTGVVFQRNFAVVVRLLAGKAGYLFCGYVALSVPLVKLGFEYGNISNPISFFVLACLIFSTAYSVAVTKFSKVVPGNTDISYGLYIYHMPVINFWLFSGFVQDLLGALSLLFVILLISFSSWIFIEKPFLRFAR